MQGRLVELIDKVIEGDLSSLTLNESRELEQLLRVRVGEMEYGFPIYGEE